MKYLLILSLFIIGCCDESSNVSTTSVRFEKLEASVDRIYNRMNSLETQQVYNYAEINKINSRIGKTTMDLDECVLFNKEKDTHAAVSYTVPITGRYKYRTWDDEQLTITKNLKAGDKIDKIIFIKRDTCPGYEQ